MKVIYLHLKQITFLERVKIKKFIAFDGEGSNLNNTHNYFLLASSDGKYIINKDRTQLSLNDILEFLTREELLSSINVWFAFNYDICMIFKTLPNNLQFELFHGKDIIYNNFKIHYIPKKILTLKPDKKKAKSFIFYDIYGFFQTSFENACQKWNINIPEIIKKGKAERQNFQDWNINDIIEYNEQELTMLLELIEKLETQLIVNQIDLSSYHGAGAIAQNFLQKWIPIKKQFSFKYKHAINKKTILYPEEETLPNWIRLASRASYFGGRIELFKRYDFNDIYHYDINSAYPTAIQYLPDLTKNKWYFIKNPSLKKLLNSNGNAKFGICDVSWNSEPNYVGPFPFRTKNNSVLFPNYSINANNEKIKARGRYHNIEIVTALKKHYPIKIHSAFLFEEPYHFPLQKHIQEIAQKRLELKKLQNGELLSMPLKLGMNSLYGKIAQKPELKCGLEHKHFSRCFKISFWRELLFAGYITAYTRSQLLEYLKPNSIILTATDGLYSLEELDCPIGQKLGQWEFKKHKSGKFLLAGIYLLDENDMKTRGFPKISIEKFNEILKYEKNRSENSEPYIIKDRMFIGIRKALKLKDKSLMCSFQEVDRIIDSHNNQKRIFIDNYNSLPNNFTRADYSYPYSDITINNDDIDEKELDYETFDI